MIAASNDNVLPTGENDRSPRASERIRALYSLALRASMARGMNVSFLPRGVKAKSHLEHPLHLPYFLSALDFSTKVAK